MAICISLFDYTGAMLKPWAEAGYKCWAYDLQHAHLTERCEDGIMRVKLDLAAPVAVNVVADLIERHEVAFLSAFPPCTHLAISGARWLKGKGLRALQESIGFFATSAELAEAAECPYLIENPMSTISTYWREPDHKFHPWHYAGWNQDDHYTKETWLWTGGGFVMPEPSYADFDLVGLPDDRIHKAAPSPERANFRSATPAGFAKAVYAANH